MSAGRDAKKQAKHTTAASCPKCQSPIVLWQVQLPDIDSSGVESYFFKCGECGAWLVGIVDPYDKDSLTI
jgi:DNA-directed RNA polymerase subunit M/transcription elongation factor TFIIS